jgi:hypothetical protein
MKSTSCTRQLARVCGGAIDNLLIAAADSIQLLEPFLANGTYYLFVHSFEHVSDKSTTTRPRSEQQVNGMEWNDWSVTTCGRKMTTQTDTRY